VNQSTFFVELAETAAALRGASRRSLVIMDELGRGTSTFDGTAIASATVQHLVEQNKCLTLFATHYHSLLEEWKVNNNVILGHMECLVEQKSTDGEFDDCNITFLYTLGSGACPKSFGINVARLAGLPDEVLIKAKCISSEFEDEMSCLKHPNTSVTCLTAAQLKQKIVGAIRSGTWVDLELLWEGLKNDTQSYTNSKFK
jgi:DNA mismatch repair protein MSH6